jgi:alpha-galactosidase
MSARAPKRSRNGIKGMMSDHTMIPRYGILLAVMMIMIITVSSLEAEGLKSGEIPRINGPMVYGARPNHPFLYRIPVTGQRPMKFSATDIPPGLTLDRTTGIISGFAKMPGTNIIMITARNAAGYDKRTLHIVIGDQLALTPPMGWSSWCSLQSDVSDRDIRAQADALVSSGLINHGYTYINIDEGWSIKLAGAAAGIQSRDVNGNLKCNERFPDMKALTDYLHKQGMKAGIYTSPGPLTCGMFVGSYGHEQQDAEQFAAWGFDLLKYDECTYQRKDDSLAEFQKPYRHMGAILAGLDRDIIFNLCQYGEAEVWKWGREVGGQYWRISGDVGWGPKGIYSIWDNIAGNLEQSDKSKWAGPGGWNDLDDLLIGYIAYVDSNAKPPNAPIDRMMPAPLTPDEQYTQMSLWSLLAAPLLIGSDLTKLDNFTLSILTNDEVIAIDQDSSGREAACVSKSGGLSVWAKDLADGSKAVGLFNLGDSESDVTAKWVDLGITGKQFVRDLWRQKNLGSFENECQRRVAPHGVVLIKISSADN